MGFGFRLVTVTYFPRRLDFEILILMQMVKGYHSDFVNPRGFAILMVTDFRLVTVIYSLKRWGFEIYSLMH